MVKLAIVNGWNIIRVRFSLFVIIYAYLIQQQRIHLLSDVQVWIRVSRGPSLLLAVFVRRYGWIIPEGSGIAEILCAIQCPRMSGGMGK